MPCCSQLCKYKAARSGGLGECSLMFYNESGAEALSLNAVLEL